MSRPQSFGTYDLSDRINVGGMAEVFRATHRPTGRLVALKRILPSVAEDEEFISMFRDEATIASQLDHPNIAKIHDIGRVDSSYFIALEYVHGRDMRTIFDHAVRTRTPLPIDFVFYVIMSLCKGLEYAHQRRDAHNRPLGLVHRDVSPQNILISFDGDMKLIDFGIAKAAGKLARTQVGAIKGKFGYMSPEQVRGLPVDRRSDIFSVGICFWEFLTLKRLFYGDNEIVVMEKIRNADVPPLTQAVPTLPVEVERIVMRALAKDVDGRYNSVSELLAELSAFAHADGIVVQRERVAEYMRRAFTDDAAKNAAPREEAHAMADNKGGSDLDVFEGLARKPQPRPGAPQSTAPFPGAPSGSPSVPGAPPPPPRAKTLLGMAPMVAPPMGPPSGRLPPPSMPSTPGLPPPVSGRGGALPVVAPPPPRTSQPPPAPGFPPARSGVMPAPGPLPAPLPPPTHGPGATTAPGMPPPTAPATVDMDWDDEDEKTHVYDKQSAEDVAQAVMRPLPAAGTPAPPSASAAAALMARSGNVAPPIPRPPSIPPPGTAPMSMPQPQAAQAMPAPQPIPMPMPALQEKSGAGKIIAALLAAVVILGAVGAAVFFLRDRPGNLKVYAAGPGGRDVPKVEILLDGQKATCPSVPCTLELKPGTYKLKAKAEGYQDSPAKDVEIKSGQQAALNLELEKAGGLPAGTGFQVAAGQDGVKLFVDGKEIGPLPQTLKDLAPGEHKLKFTASERYKPEERTITVVADKLDDLGSIKLKVLKGKATLKLETTGAKIQLVPSAGDRRQIEEKLFVNGQLSLDIDTTKEWRIEATKANFDDLRLPIAFEDGQAEKTFVIALSEKGKTPVAAATGTAAPPTTGQPATTAEPHGDAKLNINSIPPGAAVLLDGRPIGKTPKSGVTVPPGSHTVTFIHPEKGKKTAAVTVKPGETKGVGVKF